MSKRSIIARLFRPEAKSLADPGSDLYALFGLVPTASGVMVSAGAAISVPAVGAAIRVISEAAAILPLTVKRIGADGKETDEAGHWAGDLLARPNEWTGRFEFVRDLMIDALTEDRGGLAWVNRLGDGRIAELIRYRAGCITVDYPDDTGRPEYRLNNRPVALSDMIHVRAPFGKAPLTLAREAIGIALVLERHASRLFGKGARPSGALMFPKGMGEESVRNAIKAWRATHEADGDSGKTAILYDGADFKPFAFTSTDAQFIENRKFQILEIARCFRVPPSMLFELDRATWSNTEQLGREFLTYCLDPWLQSVEAALARVLFPDDPALVVRFDRDDLSRADLATRATTINSLIASETINPNEGRDWIGLAPYEGGNKFGNRNINPDQGGRPVQEEKPDGTE